jgi:hypothetical protein
VWDVAVVLLFPTLSRHGVEIIVVRVTVVIANNSDGNGGLVGFRGAQVMHRRTDTSHHSGGNEIQIKLIRGQKLILSFCVRTLLASISQDNLSDCFTSTWNRISNWTVTLVKARDDMLSLYWFLHETAYSIESQYLQEPWLLAGRV